MDGGYSQRDVMEVARCLSGWSVRSDEAFGKGRVEFHAERHDDGAKTVLGVPIEAGLGEKDFDAVLDIVALHPSTARYLASKLCRVFIADEPPERAVGAVADAFTQSRGDIRATLRALLDTPELRQRQGLKLKRPFHFVVSALRATGARTDGGEAVTRYLLSMGHSPHQYPTPDGYPADAGPWYGTLLWRWSFAAALSQGRIAGTSVDLQSLVDDFGGVPQAAAHVLGRRPTSDERDLLGQPGPQAMALLLASPAFQRC